MKKYTKRRRGLTKRQRKNKKSIKLKNKRLVKKYYWLMPTNWEGKVDKYFKDYHCIEWGWSPGWDKAFGQMYMDELGKAIKESGQKDFKIYQIKEKYGQARLYCSGACDKVHDIIRKYEMISENVCYYCGKEAPMTDGGWVLPQCFKCFCRVYRRREQYSINNNPEIIPKTDEELRELYNKIIIDEPDEHGEYHIAESYTVRRFSKDGNKDVVYNITDTVNKIRERQKKWYKKTL